MTAAPLPDRVAIVHREPIDTSVAAALVIAARTLAAVADRETVDPRGDADFFEVHIAIVPGKRNDG